MLTSKDLNQYYGGSHILRDITFEAPPRASHRIARSQWRRQKHFAEIPDGSRARARRRGFLRRQGYYPCGPARPGAPRSRLCAQGREIFPRLTVEENLLTGLAGNKSREINPAEIYEMFPVLKEMRRRRGGDLSGGQRQQLAIGRALTMAPKLLILDEPTEGIQPSIIQQIQKVLHRVKGARHDSPDLEAIKAAVRRIKEERRIAILLVEQYLDFAREICDYYCVLDRGAIIMEGDREHLLGDDVKRWLSV